MHNPTDQKIIHHISSYVSLSEDEKRSILKSLQDKTFPKGTHILREGEVSKECYFNIQGLVRQYEIHYGEEKTTYFYPEAMPSQRLIVHRRILRLSSAGFVKKIRHL